MFGFSQKEKERGGQLGILSLRFTGTTQLTSLPALPSLVHFLVGGQESDPPVCIFTLVTNWVDSRCVRGKVAIPGPPRVI